MKSLGPRATTPSEGVSWGLMHGECEICTFFRAVGLSKASAFAPSAGGALRGALLWNHTPVVPRALPFQVGGVAVACGRRVLQVGGY